MSKVLVVDDDAGLLKLVRAALAAAGHSAVTTDRPQKVVELAEAEHFDAVILDVLMPGVDGYEVLREIRRHPALHALPVLMLSALSERYDRVRGLKEGADDYLTKPFDAEELVLRIERLAERGAAARAHFQGSLEHFTLPEVLQQLEMGGKTGRLVVDCGDLQGTVSITRGRVVAASLAGLEGEQACFAMLELARGGFRFVSGPVESETGAGSSDPISVQYLVIEDARVLDELAGREAVSQGARLWAIPEGGPPPCLPDPETGALPVKVWNWIADRPGVSRRHLAAAWIGAPRTVEMALAALSEAGALRVERKAEPRRERAEDAAQRPAAAVSGPLAAAVEAVLRAAAAQKIAPSSVPILVIVGDRAAVALAGLVDALAGAQDVVLPERLVESLRRGQRADIGLRQNVGTVVISLVQLGTPKARERTESLLEDCAVAVLWPQGEARPEAFSWIVPRVEASRSVRFGLLITGGAHDAGVFLPLIEGTRSWSLLGAEPASIAGLLRVAAEGLWTRA